MKLQLRQEKVWKSQHQRNKRSLGVGRQSSTTSLRGQRQKAVLQPLQEGVQSILGGQNQELQVSVSLASQPCSASGHLWTL